MSVTAETTETIDSNAREPLTLEGLAGLGAGELAGLYGRGTLPRIRDLDGPLTGRMLAAAGPLGQGLAFDLLRRFAGSGVFPWAGKSFAPLSDEQGQGMNRLRLAGDFFRFVTRAGPSAVDGQPCVVLDYDQPTNPWVIRQIHDELREVSKGLFLGPAMWKTRSGPRLILYFAVQAG